jgi:dTDP-4-dehydrorhamnose 3,5-epimerase
MKIEPTRLPDVLIIEFDVYRDHRGYFLETWHQGRYAEAGLPARFVQDNISFSTRGVLRGLHYQHPSGQGKLLSVLQGEIFDVAVDIRVGSPTFGHWEGIVLSAENRRQFFVPAGFAHGFVVTGDSALVSYKCTEFYRPGHEGSVLWSDPDLDIAWPLSSPALSPKDQAAPRLADVPRDRLPSYDRRADP